MIRSGRNASTSANVSRGIRCRLDPVKPQPIKNVLQQRDVRDRIIDNQQPCVGIESSHLSSSGHLPSGDAVCQDPINILGGVCFGLEQAVDRGDEHRGLHWLRQVALPAADGLALACFGP